MLEGLPTLVHLLKVLQQVPYLASKNLYKVTSHFLEMSPQQMEQFCSALDAIKKKLAQCKTCFFWREISGDCMFCASSKREKDIICVVESWHEIITIEKTKGYSGVYHVLGGAISPLDGINVEDLTINALLERVVS